MSPAAGAGQTVVMTTQPYLDPTLPVDDRVDDLLSRMTLEEKAGQLCQYFYFGSATQPSEEDIAGLPADQQEFARQPAAVEAAIARGWAGSALFVKDPVVANRLQRLAVDETRLGIPLIFGYDVIHGLRTILPVPIGLAASWDPDVITAGQIVAAREARAAGIHWTFAPMVDIARDPRWGRIVEGAGEDPYLGAAVARAQVEGFQDHLGPQSVLACPKHFAGYGAARGGRDYDDSEISDSELHNVYLPPFRAAVDAGAATVMSAYMDLNGVPATGNPWLLTDVLRTEFGFDGFVVSDANAVQSLETQHFASSRRDAAVRAVKAGLDMEMCMTDPAYTRLPEAVERGLVDEAVIDQAARRVLAAKIRLGLFEHPYVDAEEGRSVLTAPWHREVATTAATRSAVLLRNEDATLPLDASTIGSIAVIGQLADSRRDTLGPWVFAYDLDETVTLLDGIRARAGGADVGYAPGAGLPTRLHASMFDDQDHATTETGADHDDDVEIERAVSLAARADVAIVVVGERQNQIGERASRSALDLPGRTLEQLQRIVATGTPTVVVSMSGRPLDLRWADEHAAAILQVWYPGSRGGEAVAGLLFGDHSPAGRLPFTWPRTVGQLPMIYSHLRTFQPQEQGRRYWDEESTPLYPFGHGLSYARFSYDHLRLSSDHIAVGASTTVSVDVTNTGPVPADEVVQLYVHQRYGTSSRPVRELKGFARQRIDVGETVTVSFDLGPDELRYWSAATRDWVQDETTLDVWVGGSSTAELGTVLVVGPDA